MRGCLRRLWVGAMSGRLGRCGGLSDLVYYKRRYRFTHLPGLVLRARAQFKYKAFHSNISPLPIVKPRVVLTSSASKELHQQQPRHCAYIYGKENPRYGQKAVSRNSQKAPSWQWDYTISQDSAYAIRIKLQCQSADDSAVGASSV